MVGDTGGTEPSVVGLVCGVMSLFVLDVVFGGVDEGPAREVVS